MTKNNPALFPVLLILVIGLAFAPAAQGAEIASRVIVRPATGPSGGSAAALWNTLGFHLHGSIPQLGVYVLDVPKNTSVNVAISELVWTRAFELVEEDKLLRASFTPNDPDYPSQWDLPKVRI